MDHKGQRHLIASGGVHGHDPDETLLKSWSGRVHFLYFGARFFFMLFVIYIAWETNCFPIWRNVFV